MKIEVRDLGNHEEWHACFSSDYIEELTRKTGNYKAFNVFLSMLQMVVCKKSKSLSLDLVAYEDLESFRKPRASFDSSKSSSSSDPANNKRRYLILTYISDFDKTFYPLPLSYVGVQGKDKLFKQVYKLRDSLYNNANREMNKFSGEEFGVVDKDECEARIRKVEAERDAALIELDRLKSVIRVLHKDSSIDKDSFKTCLGTSQFSSKGIRRNTSYTGSSSSLGSKSRQTPEPVRKCRSPSFERTSSNNSLHRSVLSRSCSQSSLRSQCSQATAVPNDRSKPRSRRPIEECEYRFGSRSSAGTRSRSFDTLTCRRRNVFDPTAFIREQQRKREVIEQKRQKELLVRLRRTPSPLVQCTPGARHSRSPASAIRRGITRTLGRKATHDAAAAGVPRAATADITTKGGHRGVRCGFEGDLVHAHLYAEQSNSNMLRRQPTPLPVPTSRYGIRRVFDSLDTPEWPRSAVPICYTSESESLDSMAAGWAGHGGPRGGVDNELLAVDQRLDRLQGLIRSHFSR